MASRPFETAELEMLTAAFLAGEGKTQLEIARLLGLSQAGVSRLLAAARGQFLREEVRFLKEKLDAETMRKVLERVHGMGVGALLEQASLEYGGNRGPFLRVFPGAGTDPADFDRRLLHFGRQASPYIKDLLSRSAKCGIAWGKTLGMAVGALKELGIASPWYDNEVDIIPLNGDPLGDLPGAHSPSVLADELGRTINGERYKSLSLSMVPAFIPEGFSRAETEGVRRLIGLVDAYEKIFGSGRVGSAVPLVERLDSIITSVGPASRALGHGRGRLLETGNVSIRELQQIALGDIGGVCLPRPDLSRSATRKLQSLTSRWTGLKRSHLDACAKRAANADPISGKPGVIVVAIGANKAECVYEAVKQGLVNHLVIDTDLERALYRLLKSDPRLKGNGAARRGRGALA